MTDTVVARYEISTPWGFRKGVVSSAIEEQDIYAGNRQLKFKSCEWGDEQILSRHAWVQWTGGEVTVEVMAELGGEIIRKIVQAGLISMSIECDPPTVGEAETELEKQTKQAENTFKNEIEAGLKTEFEICGAYEERMSQLDAIRNKIELCKKMLMNYRYKSD